MGFIIVPFTLAQIGQVFGLWESIEQLRAQPAAYFFVVSISRLAFITLSMLVSLFILIALEDRQVLVTHNEDTNSDNLHDDDHHVSVGIFVWPLIILLCAVLIGHIMISLYTGLPLV